MNNNNIDNYEAFRREIQEELYALEKSRKRQQEDRDKEEWELMGLMERVFVDKFGKDRGHALFKDGIKVGDLMFVPTSSYEDTMQFWLYKKCDNCGQAIKSTIAVANTKDVASALVNDLFDVCDCAYKEEEKRYLDVGDLRNDMLSLAFHSTVATERIGATIAYMLMSINDTLKSR